jgi:putative oxidoreductase
MRLDNAFYATWTPRAQALLRIVTGYLYLWHGSAKLLAVPHIAAFDKLQLFSLMGFAGVLELGGGILMVLGLFTRPVAFILSGEMAFAYFMGHAPSGNVHMPLLNRGELAIEWCFVFLFFAAAGGGAWSVDGVRRPARA